MKYELPVSSLARLDDVHEDLAKVILTAASDPKVKFIVTEGVRSIDRQRKLFAAGASKTMNSRHLTGHAVDLAAVIEGQVRWDWPLFLVLASMVRTASLESNVAVRWGGSWSLLRDLPEVITTEHLSRSFPDGPHFELSQQDYPL